MPAFEKPKSPAGRQGTKAGRARFCLRIQIRRYRFHVRSQQTGYFHRGRLRAGVAAPHPYFQKGIRESAKSKRRESVRAAPKRLRSRSRPKGVTATSCASDRRERARAMSKTEGLATRASALSAVFSHGFGALEIHSNSI